MTKCKHCGDECDTGSVIIAQRERDKKVGLFWTATRPLCLPCCRALEAELQQVFYRFCNESGEGKADAQT
jgi:hypothetical protein